MNKSAATTKKAWVAPIFYAYEFQNYIDGGMVFDFGSILPSHVLVQKIYELSANIRSLLNGAYEPSDERMSVILCPGIG